MHERPDAEREPQAGPGHDPDEDAATGVDRETAYDLLQRGHALLEGRHHAQAAIVLERADRIEPGKQSIVEALGRAYFNSGQHDRARGAFERLLELDPSAHYGHYALGQSLKRLGRREEAGTHLRLAVALSPGTRLYRDALNRLLSGPPRPLDEASTEGASASSDDDPPTNGGPASTDDAPPPDDREPATG